jgi:lincosamide nucleotidyltransferase B/F
MSDLVADQHDVLERPSQGRGGNMTSDNYRTFTERLCESLHADPEVLGFVALGSMAAVDYEPDKWSDHDFFVVVKAGSQAHYRENLSWLPDDDQIAMAFRETEHGLKVLYRGGHLLEFAVFDLDELRLARINRFRVLIDRADVTSALERVRTQTIRAVESGRKDATYRVGMILSNLLVGVGRYARGERLSGTQFVKGHALGQILALAGEQRRSDRGAADDLDPYRRFELTHPGLAQEFEHAIRLATPLAARALLDIARRELALAFENVRDEAVDAVRGRIDEAIRDCE